MQPRQLFEVKCADLSLSPVYCAGSGLLEQGKGIALRFPRFVRERGDKGGVEQATSSREIVEYYRGQPVVLGKEEDKEMGDEFDL